MKKKSSILVNTLVLLVITFVAVLALAVVNQITKEPIAQAEINARAEAYKIVYPDAANFAEVENTQTLLDDSEEMLSEAGYTGCTVDDVLAVTDSNGSAAGYVISSTSPSGYGGDIKIALGITADGKITGFTVLSNSETAGLGSKCTNPEFTSQFAGKSAAILEYSKTGASADNEIDAISGATITTKAVTEAANAAIIFYQSNFGGGVSENINEQQPNSENDADISASASVQEGE